MTDDNKQDAEPIVDRTRLGLYLQESANIVGENKLLRMVLIAMVVWSAFNSIMLQRALNARTVIIMPPDESFKVELSNGKAGDRYLYRMARHLTFLVGNMNAATGGDQLQEVLMMIHPSVYGSFQTHFATLSKEIERYPNISYVVQIDGDNAIAVKGERLLVNVTKKRLVGDTVTRKDRLVYEFVFKIEAGRLWILDIKEIPQNGEHHED